MIIINIIILYFKHIPYTADFPIWLVVHYICQNKNIIIVSLIMDTSEQLRLH